MRKNLLWVVILCMTAMFVAQTWGAEEPIPANTVIIEPSTIPATQPVVVKQSFQLDEKRLIAWGLVGTAAILGFFKLIDLIIERMGNTRKLLQEQGFLKKQMQQTAQNVDKLNDVVDQNKPGVTSIPAAMANTTKNIGTGTGTGT